MLQDALVILQLKVPPPSSAFWGGRSHRFVYTSCEIYQFLVEWKEMTPIQTPMMRFQGQVLLTFHHDHAQQHRS